MRNVKRGMYMEYSAITHYMEKRYCYSIGKGRFIIRIETKKNDMSKVVLHYRDKYIPLDFLDTRESKNMSRIASDRFKDYYEVEIDIDCICLRYQFELVDREGNVSYYGNYEFFEEKIDNIDWMFDLPQNLREEEKMEVPQWARNKIVYQIFPARYATTENVSEAKWYKSPIGFNDDLKGNLQGLINSLNHIKELGADVVYLTPIFKSNSSHKYDTIDYYQIDPGFGNENQLKELVDKAHSMDMKVILDGVFNHTSPNFFAFADIREKQQYSEYVNWYYIEDFPLKFGSRREKPNFKTFAYFGGMPKLNLNNPDTADYFVNVGRYWIEKCNIDGWRLDVGDEIPHFFWKKFRNAIKAIKPEALIIGEIWHYAGDFLEGDEWDTVMNYPFYLAVQNFVAKETLTATNFVENLDFMRGRLYKQLNPVLFNLIDSHDTARFLHVAGEDKDKLKLAAAMQLLLPGMPMIYYGDEYGITGGNDPDCRRGMLWDEKYQDRAVYDWYRTLIKVRKENPVLLEGQLIESYTDDANGIIKQVRELNDKKITVIFHGKGNQVKLDEYIGSIEALTGQVYDGVVKAYQTLVFLG